MVARLRWSRRARRIRDLLRPDHHGYRRNHPHHFGRPRLASVRSVLTAPGAFVAWASPGHRLAESDATRLAGGSFPSVNIPHRPRAPDGLCASRLRGPRTAHGPAGTFSATFVQTRGFDSLGRSTTTRSFRRSVRGGVRMTSMVFRALPHQCCSTPPTVKRGIGR